MAEAINLIYQAFMQVRANGAIILDEDFMMNILLPVVDKLTELSNFLEWYFKKKRTLVYGSFTKDSRKLGIDIVRAEVFYPSKRSNRETTEICKMLGEEVGDIIVIECEDTSVGKVTHQYIDELDSPLSMKNTTDAQLKASIGVRANNDASEHNFELLNDSLSIIGLGHLHRAAGQANCLGNNDNEMKMMPQPQH